MLQFKVCCYFLYWIMHWNFHFLAVFSFCSHMLDYLWCYRNSSVQEEEEFLYPVAGYTDLPNIQ